MPRYLPAHRELVYASGVAEIAGGAGVLHPTTAPRRGLVADRHARRRSSRPTSRWPCTPSASSSSRQPLLWARLPAAGRADRVGVADRGALAAAVAVAQAPRPALRRPGHPARPAQRPRPPAPGAGGRARGGHDRAGAPGHGLAAARARDRGAPRRARARPSSAPSDELPPGPHEHDGPRAQLLDLRAEARRAGRPGRRRRGAARLPRGAARLPRLAPGARRA